MKKYIVLVGDSSVKVTEVIPEDKLKLLTQEQQNDYDKCRQIGKSGNFYLAHLIESPCPELAIFRVGQESAEFSRSGSPNMGNTQAADQG